MLGDSSDLSDGDECDAGIFWSARAKLGRSSRLAGYFGVISVSLTICMSSGRGGVRTYFVLGASMRSELTHSLNAFSVPAIQKLRYCQEKRSVPRAAVQPLGEGSKVKSRP